MQYKYIRRKLVRVRFCFILAHAAIFVKEALLLSFTLILPPVRNYE